MPPKKIEEKEVDMVKKYLTLVFKHEIDPSMGDADHQQELNIIHNPPHLGDSILRC